MSLGRYFVSISVLLGIADARAQDPAPPRPLPADAALKTIAVPDGFRVDLVAAEPDVIDPVALAFDEDGRLFVAEMRDYPLGPPSGVIRLLEDRDRDGRYERSTVYASKIPFPTGLLPWRGGLLVCAVPDILLLKDTDGDGRADSREVLLTGFREGNAQNPQANVNSLRYGLDGWVYAASARTREGIRSMVRPSEKPLKIRASDIRFHPDTGAVEAVAAVSQFALTFDEWGNRFINSNSKHVHQVVLPVRYVRRHGHLTVSALEEDISDHGDSARVFPRSRMEQRFNDPKAAGHITSACSLTYYGGSAFPPGYDRSTYVCEPVHNLVHQDVLVPRGAAFTARRKEADREFFASTDLWCRPVNLEVGPDGALYVADMYRFVIDHPKFMTLDVLKRLDVRAGQDRGRIYRVAASSSLPAAPERLGAMKAEDLVGRLEHPNAWHRSTAQRLILHRGGRDAVEPLRKLLATSKAELGRLHALWTLEALGALETDAIAASLRDTSPGVRAHAVRLAESRLEDSDALRLRLTGMADDVDARVRFQLALTLGDVPGDAARRALAGIAVRDAADRWVRSALLTSVAGNAPRFLAALRDHFSGFLETPAPGALDLVRRLAAAASARRNEEEIVSWLRVAVAEGTAKPARWQETALAFLAGLKRSGRPVDRWLETAGLRKTLSAWAPEAVDRAGRSDQSVDARVDALALAELFPAAESVPRLRGLLDPKVPREVQVAAVRSLASLPDVPLLDGWSAYTVPVRREILNILFRRSGGEPVLKAVEMGTILPNELDLQNRRRLLQHKDPSVRARAEKALKREGAEDREELVREMTPKVLALKGDRARGEKVYLSNCASCHRWYGQGLQVGPSLASAASREKEKLIADILDPNSAVDPAYQVYVITTRAGELVTGIIVNETPNSLTLRRAAAQETTVLRSDIGEIKAWPASLMPDGVENNVDAQGFADLLEFIKQGSTR